jgi:hypothetical protein
MNFLERLVADWYGHQGYLVQTNMRFGKRTNGGYDGEMDVLAVNLKNRSLVHVETSSDADSWDERRERVIRKFKNVEKHYLSDSGLEFKVTRLAVVGARKPKKQPIAIDGIEVISIDELMRRIKEYVGRLNPASEAVPEGFGYLRAIQFAVWFGK